MRRMRGNMTVVWERVANTEVMYRVCGDIRKLCMGHVREYGGYVRRVGGARQYWGGVQAND